MFRCTYAPPQPFYPPDLEQLGYRLDERKRFVNINTGAVFDFYHTDNEHANELREESFHVAARTKIAQILREQYSVQELYLTGSKYHTERPDEPHVSILCTKVSELRLKCDIVVVIGQAGEDAGIWDWRVASNEGGIETGSAVGLAAKLAAFGQSVREDDFEGRYEEPAVREQLIGGKEKDMTPGLIVLNPGQLLYSHQMSKNMTLTSWNHRRRPNAFCDEYNIDPQHNFVRDHKDPQTHLHTCFEHLLQQVMSHDARLYCIMVGDGSIHGLHALDQILMNKNPTEIRGGKLEAVAMVEPQHDAGECTDQPGSPDGLFCEHFKQFLATHGRSWVSSDTVPKGKEVARPIRGRPGVKYTPGAEETGSDIPLAGVPTTPTPVAPKKDEKEEWGEPEGVVPEIPQAVSCVTVSAGPNEIGLPETVFPAVQDDVLGFIFTKMEQARAR